MIHSLKTWKSVAIVAAIAALVFAIACGDDAPEPVPTVDTAKLIQEAVASAQSASAAEIERSVAAAIAEQPQGASAAEIQNLVADSVTAAIAAQPAGLTRADVQSIVSQSTEGQLSAADVTGYRRPVFPGAARARDRRESAHRPRQRRGCRCGAGRRQRRRDRQDCPSPGERWALWHAYARRHRGPGCQGRRGRGRRPAHRRPGHEHRERLPRRHEPGDRERGCRSRTGRSSSLGRTGGSSGCHGSSHALRAPGPSGNNHQLCGRLGSRGRRRQSGGLQPAAAGRRSAHIPAGSSRRCQGS